MRNITRLSLGSVVAIVALGAGTGPSTAQDALRTYTVTSISQTAQGKLVTREVLSLQADGQRSRLQVAAGDGSTFAQPVALTPQGQIDSSTQDHSVTCYNMAMGVLAHERTAGDPPAVFVRFFSTVVNVPLHVQATHEQGGVRTISLDGAADGVLANGTNATAAGVAIGATVTERDGILAAATFDEFQHVGSAQNIIARSTCILERATPAVRATTST
jgi:hypothetical protein